MPNPGNDVDSSEEESEEKYTAKEIPEPLMEQYLHFAESAIETSSRRVSTNRFIGTLLTAVLALLTLFGPNSDSTGQFLAIAGIGGAGAILCYFWYKTVQSYKNLNSAKYEIITQIEKEMMPVEPYADEWRYLDHDSEEPKLIKQPDEDIDHTSQTEVESKLIGLLFVGYIIVLLFGLYGIGVSTNIISDCLNIIN